MLFFQILFSLILTVYKGRFQLLFLGAVCSTGFLKGREYCFWSLFRLKSSNCFPVKTHAFGRSLFCTFFFVMMGLWVFAVMWYPCCVRTSQDYIKVEHIRTWLLSSSSANFQQFWSECFFFQVLFSLILTLYKGHIQLLFLEAVCSTQLFALG